MSSKRRLRRSACTSKVRHDTAAQAHKAIAYLRRDPRYDGQALQAYGCRFCGGYHFGHMPRAVAQAIASRREGWSR